MNQFIRNLNRLEFLVTLACTGRCRHCSEGEHESRGEHLDGRKAANAVSRICKSYSIESLMTFGGEALLFPDDVYEIHRAAKEMNILKRQLITNGFFSTDKSRIREVAAGLARSGVNEVLLSADAFHQETIPLTPVKLFAEAVLSEKIGIRMNPAWLVGDEDDNAYNRSTRRILREFEPLGVFAGEGNVIFPSGNAKVYLAGYFEPGKEYLNPYEDDPRDLRSVCVCPDGGLLGGNIYETDALDILDACTV